LPTRCPQGQELLAEACIAYCADATAGAGGFLTLNSIPQAWVLLDGCLLGHTPQIKRPVTNGAHEVVFVHDERGRITKRVDVSAGKTQVVAVKLR